MKSRQLFLFIFLISSLNLALYYENYDINVVLDLDGTAHEKITATVLSDGFDNTVTFNAVKDVNNVQVMGKDGDLVKYKITETDYAKKIVIEFKNPFNEAKPRTFILSFDTKQFTKIYNDNLEFETTFNAPATINNLDFSLTLPEGYILPLDDNANDNSVTQLTPIVLPDASFKSDGKHLILQWNKKNLTINDDPLSIFVRAKKLVKYKESKTPKLEIGILALSMVFFFLSLYLYKSQPKAKTETSILVVSSEDEEIVVDTLIKNKGPMKQSDIIKKTDFSKSKLSRVIMGLETKKIISKKKSGPINIIMLNK